ncbi:hypothetical protein [Phenylobacterium sp.]|uniref:hypothetical protein n=1 Tax=Phenylobacterium sp. TaxID=1871053 RepID=UPI002CBAFBED|nr:hypothetical protein [Phenylobacterium sp.]HLZ76044.1 hypothetical protein [Phenylobacterium sp.]
MKFEVLEDDGGWIVRRNGVEIARHREQEQALSDIAERLRGDGRQVPDRSYSLTMRYLART